MKNKIATIYLMGGFGNQLFQLCFAKSLEDLGLKVYIDTDNYLKKNIRKDIDVENRELTLPIELYGFKKAPNYLKLLLSLYNKLRNYSFKNSKFLLVGRFNDKNFNGDFKTINQFVGYWQDIELINDYKDFLLSKLSKEPKINESLIQEPIKGSTMIHVRRKDYLSMGEELSLDYYKISINLAKRNINNFYFDVFTDDKDWVLSSSIFSNARNIFYSSSSREDTIGAFSEMIKYENFIISNSTFSLIPAMLGKSNNKNVFAPEPWFRNLQSLKNYPESWRRVKNE